MHKMISALKIGIFLLAITLAACSSSESQKVESTRLLVGADDSIRGMELWISDGTASGTTLVKDINPEGDAIPTDMTVLR